MRTILSKKMRYEPRAFGDLKDAEKYTLTPGYWPQHVVEFMFVLRTGGELKGAFYRVLKDHGEFYELEISENSKLDTVIEKTDVLEIKGDLQQVARLSAKDAEAISLLTGGREAVVSGADLLRVLGRGVR